MSDLDLSLFSYFRFVSGMEFALFFDDPTWERRALQIAHSEPTILHAVLAISALSRHQNSGGKFWNDSSQPCSVLEYSTKQYNLAIQCLTSRLGKPAEHTNILIIGSLLFIHIEFMRGSQESVFLHLHGASALLKSLKEYSYETEYLEAALAYIEAQLHGLLSYEATKTCQSMIRQPDPASFIYPASVAKALDQQDHFTVIDVPDIFRRETYSLTTDRDIELVLRCILAIIPSHVDPATEEILKLAKKVDSDVNRTVVGPTTSTSPSNKASTMNGNSLQANHDFDSCATALAYHEAARMPREHTWTMLAKDLKTSAAVLPMQTTPERPNSSANRIVMTEHGHAYDFTSGGEVPNDFGGENGLPSSGARSKPTIESQKSLSMLLNAYKGSPYVVEIKDIVDIEFDSPPFEGDIMIYIRIQCNES
ncbi:hypothetical protein BKA67DRAFT_530552 [Truncatella angustata]|uniref:Uncharacterized protein n=1 Tax=Truncatella angustata TaxID=152316 RepID=A0A9P8UWA4_9PEZI|nr:uncharacterized protein BKA67DRAFT_530552 [Truncatella angustata]KAH6660459.1 hypothetical protein BKA67DRAFT_530552 [Truncatella angustata]